MSKQSIQEKSLTVRNETQAGKNSNERIADIIDDINETKIDMSEAENVFTKKTDFSEAIAETKDLVASGVIGVLKINDPKPAVGKVGKYELSDIGTYSNLVPIIKAGETVPSNVPIITESNFQNSVYWDGTNFTQLRVNLGEVDSFKEIVFTQTVKLDSLKTASKMILSANLNYSYNPAGALSNAVRVDNIICNGKTISFSDDFTVNIQPDIDYSKPISVLFQKPLMDNLKIFVIVINISEIDDAAPIVAKRYKVKSPAGDTINSWFEYFEFENHIVVANDVIFNAGVYDEGGIIYNLANFKLLTDSDVNRFAYFVIPDTVWQPNTVFTAGVGGVNGSGVKVKTTSVKPSSFVAGNTGEFTLVEI